jgi:hypothetical protein
VTAAGGRGAPSLSGVFLCLRSPGGHYEALPLILIILASIVPHFEHRVKCFGQNPLDEEHRISRSECSLVLSLLRGLSPTPTKLDRGRLEARHPSQGFRKRRLVRRQVGVTCPVRVDNVRSRKTRSKVSL